MSTVATQREFDTLPVLSPHNRKPVGYVTTKDLLGALQNGQLRAENQLADSMRKFAVRRDYQGTYFPDQPGLDPD